MHKPYAYAQADLRAKDAFVRTSRLDLTSRIRMHKSLNAEKLYNLRKSVYIRTSRLTRKIHTNYAKPLTLCKSRTTYAPILLQLSQTNQQEKKKNVSVMAHSEKENSTRVNHGWTKSRKINALISLEDLMVKKVPLSLEDVDIFKLSVITDPTNEDSLTSSEKSSFWIILKT